MAAEPKLIATIPRSATEQLQISINEYKGKSYLNMRIFFTTDGGQTWIPTKKGVTFTPDQIDILRDAVDEAMKYDLDCLVITRGGGSKEDLRCFNDEMFLRKCLELKIPLISAVGHEIDTTLLDYISDIQAITPTQAAEKVSNPLDYFKDELNNLDALLNRDFILYIEKQTERLFNYERLIESFSLKEKLNSCLLFILKDQERLNICINRYLNDIIFDLNLKKEKLDKAFLNRLNNAYDELKSKESIFNSLSPFKALERGYSLIYKENNVITSKSQLKKGDIITINLKDGSLKAVIKENEEDL